MFENKVVVITGGANGIGRCIAEEFQSQGAKVCIIDTAPGDHFVGDLADRDTLEVFARSVIREHGRVDVLVNNAAGATSRKKMNRPEFSGRCFLLSDGLVAGLRDAVAVAVLGLPLVAVLVFFGEEACHDGGDDTAVGHEADILRQSTVSGQNPLCHLFSAFAAGGTLRSLSPVSQIW